MSHSLIFSTKFNLNIHIHIILFFSFLSLFNLRAQEYFQKPLTLNYQSGLPSNRINDIVEDKEGFIWIATDNGVCRYDGLQLQALKDLAPNSQSFIAPYNVYDLTVDSVSETLWISTSTGLYVFQSKTGDIRLYAPILEDSTSLKHPRVDYTYIDRQRNIWIGNFKQGLAIYQPESDNFEHIYPIDFFPEEQNIQQKTLLNQVQQFIQDVHADSIYWLSTRYGLIKWDRSLGKCKRFFLGRDEGNYKSSSLNSARCIYQHQNGLIFQGLWDGGFSIFDPQNESFTYSGDLEWPAAIQTSLELSVYSIYPRSDSTIYLSVSDNTLIIYDIHNQTAQKIIRGDIWDKNSFSVRLVDSQKRIWAGFRKGIKVYNPLAQQFEHFSLPFDSFQEWEYISQMALPINEDQWLISVYGAPGLYQFNPYNNTYKIVPYMDVFKGIEISKWRRKILVLEESTLLIFKSAQTKLEAFKPKVPCEDCIFSDLIIDQKDRIWLSTYWNGLFRFDPKLNAWEHFKKELQPKDFPRHHDWLYAFYEDVHSNIWMRASQGFSKYLSSKDTFLNFPFQEGQENYFTNVEAFQEDNHGRMWVAAGENGIGWLDPLHPENGLIQKLPLKEGISTNYRHLAKDLEGRIWIMGGQKLSYINPINLSMHNLDVEYGLPVYNEKLDVPALSSGKLWNLDNGKIGLAYRQGFALFDPVKWEKNTVLAQPYLTEINILGKKFITDTILYYKKSLNLNHTENFFSLEFSALNPFAGDKTKFLYKLVGFDEDWRSTSNHRQAEYTNVPGGNYTFLLKAGNNEGIWNPKPYQLQINISIPWWESSWFYGSLILSGILVLYAFYRYRLNQLKSKQQVQFEFNQKIAKVEMSALRAQMNPHFIFNCLNSIDYFIIQNDAEKASDYLNRFSRLIRLILQNSRSTKISLQDDLEALKLYIEMESLRFDDQFKYAVKVANDIDLQQIKVPPMLLQPYVENAIWHGLSNKYGKGKLDLKIDRKTNYLYCSIQDNGIGREAASKLRSKSTTRHKSFGMQIAKERLNLINQLEDEKGLVEIIDLKDKNGQADGTKVVLKIPIEN